VLTLQVKRLLDGWDTRPLDPALEKSLLDAATPERSIGLIFAVEAAAQLVANLIIFERVRLILGRLFFRCHVLNANRNYLIFATSTAPYLA